MQIEVLPNSVNVDLFGMHLTMPQTYFTSTILVLALITLVIIIRVFFVSRFTLDKPKHFQVVIEYFLETIDKFSLSAAGHLGDKLSPYILALFFFIITNGWVELFGVHTPLSDLTVTASLALITFVLINYYGFRAKGIGGRILSVFKPNPVIAPFKFISDMVLPVSMAFRMFGNILGGFIVMTLLYDVFLAKLQHFTVEVLGWAVVGAVIPGILSIYFTIFHAAIQFYIFSILSLTFVREAVE